MNTLKTSLLSLAFSAWASSAAASPDYPGLLQEQLDMPCVTQCTVCHRDTGGGRGTVVTSFGVAMIEEGLRGNDSTTMAKAIAGMDAGQYDSDGDGNSDLNELREGNNPNQSGDGLLCAQYGCGAHVAPAGETTPTAGFILGGLLGLAALRMRSVRRRSRRS